MRLGHGVVIVGLLVAAALSAGIGRGLADRIGDEVGVGLTRLFLEPEAPTVGSMEQRELAPEVAPAVPERAGSASGTEAGQPSPTVVRPTRHKSAASRRGLRISGETVLRLANGGVRPRGIPVASDGSRPAGLMLVGVGGLGIGLRDGDVLTRAGGVPARDPSDVVSLVVAARGRRVPTISGQFWRDGEAWDLVVEQPYPDPKSNQ